MLKNKVSSETPGIPRKLKISNIKTNDKSEGGRPTKIGSGLFMCMPEECIAIVLHIRPYSSKMAEARWANAETSVSQSRNQLRKPAISNKFKREPFELAYITFLLD